MVARGKECRVTDYAGKVLSGEILACKYVILACQRHINDLGRDDLYFDYEAAEKRYRFFEEYLILDTGKPFVLDDWQAFIVGSIYGWKVKKTQKRRFRDVFVMVPRKNGKTTLGAGIGMSSFVLDKENRPNIFCVASDREQASELTDCTKLFAKNHPALVKRLKVRAFDILKLDKFGGTFKALHADADRLDGKNPYMAFGDEVHAWKKRAIYDVIDSAFGSRDEPLFILITTAGVYDATKIGVELYDDAVNMLEGMHEADDLFAIIYTLDDEDHDNWTDPANWQKANPSLGSAKKLDYMQKQVEKAVRMPDKVNDVKTKQFNIWTDQSIAWIPTERWKACDQKPVFDRDEPCFGALDCANTLDFNSLTLYWPSTHSLKTWFWLPEGTIKNASERIKAKYRRWVKEGYIIVGDGDVLKKDYVKKKILELNDFYNIKVINFDRAKDGLTVAVDLNDDYGIEFAQFAQGFVTYNEPSREFERLVFAGDLRHGNNPVLNWHASSVIKKTNAADLIMPSRESEYKKIDGIVTSVMAIGAAMAGREEEEPEIYIV